MRHPLPAHTTRDQIIVLSNRQPYQHEYTTKGELRVVRGSSGVVNAVEPLLLQSGGVWVAAGGGDADRHVALRAGGVQVPPEAPRYRLRRVSLSDAEQNGFYYGFANGALWPLCHTTPVRPTFNASDFAWYERVNRRFAEAIADEAVVADPVVFAHDYHFALVPTLIRRCLPLSRVALFWHIPWPMPGVFERCPWSHALIEGVLGSTLVGFQTAIDRTNFLRCAEAVAVVDWNANIVAVRGREVRIGVYPASVDPPNELGASVGSIEQCRSEIRATLGLTSDVLLGVGVDRLDYTKGLEEKLLAIERLLDNRPDLVGRFVFAQIAQPSRECLPAYQQARDRVVAAANRINARFAGPPAPIVLLPHSHDRAAVLRFLRAGDVCYVGSLHDGMNLVSKEFVAARDDERGVLVLSAFAGASHELRDALIVDPHDTEQVARSLATAIDMPIAQQQWRMRRMRRIIARWDARRWGSTILQDVRRANPARTSLSDCVPSAARAAVPAIR
jgi:trehalose 6-phosphate synthase